MRSAAIALPPGVELALRVRRDECPRHVPELKETLIRHYPPKKPRNPDGSWGAHWLPRGPQAAFRKMLLEAEGPICFYCGATDKPLQAHHVTTSSGHMACGSCHRRETLANQLNGNPPPL